MSKQNFFEKYKMFIIGIAGLTIILIANLIFLGKNTATKIAFYQIPENTQKHIEAELLSITEGKVKFHTLKSSKPLSEKEAHKYHMIITYNSRTAINIGPEPVPDNAIKYLPTKIQLSTYQDGKNYALPFLLDHYELALYTTYKTQLGLSDISDFESFKDYLEKIKETADFPLIAIGSDDNELIGFVSAMAQSIYGVNEYFDICQEFNKAQARGDVIPYRIRVVLDEIKELENLGLLHKNWLNANIKDVIFLMEQHQLGAFVTYLSTQRQIPYVLIKYYNSYLFPQHNSTAFGVIAPEIVALKMESDKNVDLIFEKLISNQVQTNLSKKTMLAPTAAIAESSDIQSDNVRYWCAAANGGPVPDFQKASFIGPDRLHEYADKIREYLK